MTNDGIIICSYEGTLDPWMSSLWRMLNTIKPEFLPNGPDVSIQDTVLIDQPKVQITYHNIESHFSTASGITIHKLGKFLVGLQCSISYYCDLISDNLFMYVSFVVYNLSLV